MPGRMHLSFLQAATLLSVGGSVVVGCATPMPLVRLKPDTPDVVWVGGRASVQKDTTGVRVAAAFEHQDGSNLALRVEIENRTTDRLEVSPQEMTFSVCSSLPAASCTPSQRVIDPEQILTVLAVAQSRGVAEESNSQALYGTLVLLSAVGDVASAAHGRPTTGSGTLVAASAMEGDAAARNSAQASLAVQQQIWSDQALRRNTLFPGQGTSGLVYLPINYQARYLWLQITVAGRLFPFHFAQAVMPVESVWTARSKGTSENR
jgi:hypothetical protein